MALQPSSTAPPERPPYPVARQWAANASSAQIELVRRWQRLLRADAAQARRPAARASARRPSPTA
jgi:hypothetical protein